MTHTSRYDSHSRHARVLGNVPPVAQQKDPVLPNDTPVVSPLRPASHPAEPSALVVDGIWDLEHLGRERQLERKLEKQ